MLGWFGRPTGRLNERTSLPSAIRSLFAFPPVLGLDSSPRGRLPRRAGDPNGWSPQIARASAKVSHLACCRPRPACQQQPQMLRTGYCFTFGPKCELTHPYKPYAWWWRSETWPHGTAHNSHDLPARARLFQLILAPPRLYVDTLALPQARAQRQFTMTAVMLSSPPARFAASTRA